ncbi:MAG: deoxyguanosinetriphosphate triphosphohydrolase [Lentisphaerae bacterium]|nr:deoxyguanosinetriphosphate triphosphohydrolase [Victivallaceae bacterium]MDD3703763.1 deoxyguanosinetriphosphate triphosphohydrolase [Victivallaceae bacterium]MDD5664476.1 deoxyguanosinetriphosphate triphosphohydrolase [Victivallaceae bacterium]NLK83024.1 deoxyguanosinetriphosphate triphosphohydrolase [Lentisphaerota bacterium]
MRKMCWDKLLSPHRLGKCHPDVVAPGRSPFQQDFDRIVFSPAFRRLQDKAQVFPLADNDYVHTRLTHSMEVSCVGRSLGTAAGAKICAKHKLDNILPSDIGAIVAAAGLAHDIGNPPLGHSGEEAIRYWFKNSPLVTEMKKNMSTKEQADIAAFEGNAQGFRVLAKLQMPDNPGGMQLTCATLAAFAKYPVESYIKTRPEGVSSKKFNFFQAERELFRKVAEITGLISYSENSDDYCWCRHPLAWLVEAADDISYRIVDFEDAWVMGIIDYSELKELFLKLIENADEVNKKLEMMSSRELAVQFLRAKAIGCLVTEVIEAFDKWEDEILTGTLQQPLIELIPSAETLQEIYQRSLVDVYNFPRAVEIEVAGYELTEGLLDVFVSCVNEVAEAIRKNRSPLHRNKKIIQLIPGSVNMQKNPEWLDNSYYRLLTVLDFISGMTDTRAVVLFKKIKGISLPGE